MKGLYALVGMQHRGTAALVASLPDGEPVRLIREPDNPYDRNAVQVWARGTHLGFVKGTQARPLAMAMDAKQIVSRTEIETAGVLRKKIERWPLIELEE